MVNTERISPKDTPARAVLAFRIARRYGTRIPKAGELSRDFGLCRATAHRWVDAMRQALRAEQP